jgi:hypothetical protein
LPPPGPSWSWFLSPWPQPGFVSGAASVSGGAGGGAGGALTVVLSVGAGGCDDWAGGGVEGRGAGFGLGLGAGLGLGVGFEAGCVAAGTEVCGAAAVVVMTCVVGRLLCRVVTCDRTSRTMGLGAAVGR